MRDKTQHSKMRPQKRAGLSPGNEMVSGPGHEVLAHPFLLTDKGPWVRRSSQRLLGDLPWRLSGLIQPWKPGVFSAPLTVWVRLGPSPSSGPKGPLLVVRCSPAHNIPLPSTGFRAVSVYCISSMC